MRINLQAPRGVVKSSRATKRMGGRFPGVLTSHAGVASSLRYLADNYNRPIKIRDLEERAGLSRRGFFKAFQKNIGQSPAQVLRQMRIERAKRLLVERDLSLDELAIQCGYRSANTFWVAFRDVTGLAPKQFQRQTWLKSYQLGSKADILRKRPASRSKQGAIFSGVVARSGA